jgi:hypothetical protein
LPDKASANSMILTGIVCRRNLVALRTNFNGKFLKENFAADE